MYCKSTVYTVSPVPTVQTVGNMGNWSEPLTYRLSGVRGEGRGASGDTRLRAHQHT